MGNLSVKYLLFKENVMFKSQLVEMKPQSPQENRVDTYGAPIFAPDYSATVL